MTPTSPTLRRAFIPLALALAAGISALAFPSGAAVPAATPSTPAAAAPAGNSTNSTGPTALPTAYPQENTGTNFQIPDLPTQENATPIAPFPDPFAWVKDPLGATRSTAFADWEHHRAEMMAMIEKYEIGTKPAVDVATQVTATFTPNGTPAGRAPAAPAQSALGPAFDDQLVPVAAPGGGAPARGAGGRAGGFGGPGGRGPGGGGGPGGTLVVKVKVNDQTVTLTCPVSIPANAKAPYPVVIGMNSGTGSMPANEFSSRGIVAVTFRHNDVTTYSMGGTPNLANDPFFKAYPQQKFSSDQAKGNTGQYAAWAWGVSRIIDGFSLVKDQFPVDMNHICVTGCSYAGKMALFAGAFDERVALTIAQESGGGGATNWRYSATEPPDAQGKASVEGIGNTSHTWFASQLFTWAGDNLPKLPEDHHMLTSLCAPRALLVTGNTNYLWLSNPSCYVNSKATAKVYQTLGISDRFGYIVDGNHAHCQVPASQLPEIQYFLDRFMLDQKNLSKLVATSPATFAKIDADRWTQWWGTGKADLPPAKP